MKRDIILYAYQKKTGPFIYKEILILQLRIMKKKRLIENKLHIHPKILQTQKIIFLAHVFVGSHHSILQTSEQELESEYRWGKYG